MQQLTFVGNEALRKKLPGPTQPPLQNQYRQWHQYRQLHQYRQRPQRRAPDLCRQEHRPLPLLTPRRQTLGVFDHANHRRIQY
jgi:hypothetical protein